MRFGRQRPPRDLAAIALLFAGFTVLGVAFYVMTANWLGVLLPLAYVLGAWSTLRGEIREIELRADTLVLRTLFRSYPIPRAHITRIVQTPSGPAIDVLNGARYPVTPPAAAPDEVHAALTAWFAS